MPSGMISAHFSWAEASTSGTAAANGIDNSVPPELQPRVYAIANAIAEPARYLLGRKLGKETALQVNSWYRCPKVNQLIKGDASSAHMTADAIDLQPKGLDRLVLWDVFLQMLDDGFPIDRAIIYEDKPHVHVGQAWLDDPKRWALVHVAVPGTHGAPPNKSYVLWSAYKGPLKPK